MQRRNDPCPCGQGLPYKYCCIAKEPRKRELIITLDSKKKIGVKIDMSNDILNIDSSLQLPLKNFCKDHDFYFFGFLTVREVDILKAKLKASTLTKFDIFDAYKRMMKKEQTEEYVKSIIKDSEIFLRRESQIQKATSAHYNGDYELTIPVFFTLIEGVLRDFGKIKNRDDFKPTIPLKIWEEAGLYFAEDDARNYNYFVGKLFEGGKDETAFNRNPILHGFNVSYFSEEHSLLLLLTLLEIRSFMFWQKHLGFPELAKTTVLKLLSGKKLEVGMRFSFTDSLCEYNAELISV